MTKREAIDKLNEIYNEEVVEDRRSALLMAANAIGHEDALSPGATIVDQANTLFKDSDTNIVSINVGRKNGSIITYTIQESTNG